MDNQYMRNTANYVHSVQKNFLNYPFQAWLDALGITASFDDMDFNNPTPKDIVDFCSDLEIPLHVFMDSQSPCPNPVFIEALIQQMTDKTSAYNQHLAAQTLLEIYETLDVWANSCNGYEIEHFIFLNEEDRHAADHIFDWTLPFNPVQCAIERAINEELSLHTDIIDIAHQLDNPPTYDLKFMHSAGLALYNLGSKNVRHAAMRVMMTCENYKQFQHAIITAPNLLGAMAPGRLNNASTIDGKTYSNKQLLETLCNHLYNFFVAEKFGSTGYQATLSQDYEMYQASIAELRQWLYGDCDKTLLDMNDISIEAKADVIRALSYNILSVYTDDIYRLSINHIIANNPDPEPK